MKFVNLTAHAIVIRPDGGHEVTVHPSGSVARCQVVSKKIGQIGEIPILKQDFGVPQGIPEPDPMGQVRYIASTVVAQAANRSDVLSPDTGPTAYRESGQVVAVRGLQLFAQQKEFFCWYDNGSGWYEADPDAFPIMAVDAPEALRLAGGCGDRPGTRVIMENRDDDPNHEPELIRSSASLR